MIVGGRVSEGLPASPGDIRAYDVRTGALRWTFHTIPHPGEPGYETWPKDAWTYSGGANNWAGMALDEARGIVYVPTGSAAADFYGANRLGDNLFANSLLALDAATGKRIWHFQVVRHDIWDRDSAVAAEPRDACGATAGTIDAVAQTTKHGVRVPVRSRERQAAVSDRVPQRIPRATVDRRGGGRDAAASRRKPAPFCAAAC